MLSIRGRVNKIIKRPQFEPFKVELKISKEVVIDDNDDKEAAISKLEAELKSKFRSIIQSHFRKRK